MRHLIIGSGPAGVVAAETLRKADPAAEITMLCGEAGPPYSRMAIPYLLRGDIPEAGTHLRKDADHYARLRIQLVQASAKAVDTAARTVDVGGRGLSYDRLLIATGSRPSRERIPGIDLPGVQACWTLDDARAILAQARPGARIVQMGAGFVGCIIMEGLLSRGVDLTILVRSGYMVRRMMNATASDMLRRWCEAKGVKILTHTQPTGLTSEGGVLRVALADGRVLPADIYLSAVGVDPNLDFLAGSSIEVAQGIVVDDNLQSSVPGVYAAGDVAEATDCLTGKRQLNAIQPNAVEQGRIAALNMAGRAARFKGSFVFNVLTTLGLVSSSFGEWQGVPGGESAEVLDGARYRYLNLQFEGDRLVGANTVGFTDHVGALRGLIEGRVRLGAWKQRLMADPTLIMQAYLAAAHSVV
ncbi:MAG: NAD(P)/FAD-dependent oxidoreductase [Geothrix sp.]|uniref:NAD(P)/FAD-dependent oxidoreductase n=1 Tax=Geothrix sp. TaxID=1962974 RepID=UPI0017BB44FC|nr:FAD-dependent oxidoreductase [Geothrix sp.]NWJ42331.1 NAD(P)/FAD-dependent oxidoreductase [Geothrix sp.]WIL19701.1 MAG: FAD-dependent oxidoreductase [Geothrix sp.]